MILGFIAARIYPPVLPHVQVAPELYPHGPGFSLPIIGDFTWSNTLTAMVLVDIILILIAIVVRRATSSGELVPKGIAGVIEAFVEVLHGLTESTAGKWTRTIFPWFATITLLVLVANWIGLVPGTDTIGFIEPAKDHGNPVEQVFGNIVTLMPAEEDHDDYHEAGFTLLPYVRPLATDLNFTLALALISVVMTQVVGVRSLGIGYFSKFLNFRALWNFFKNPIGAIDFFVGLLEIVSEISKILSFSFRLFGNIFAGMILVFVIGFIMPVLLPIVFYLLEIFVGLIQAFVFGMLTMVFMAQATVGHGDHEEAH
jgi:F-type H+-transporting ATPase subunit a